MANINIDDYIKEMDLTPELEQKARQCNTARELMQLAADNDIELPMDALEGVAGGCGGKDAVNKKTLAGRGEANIRWCENCSRKLMSDRDYHIEYR